MQESKRERRVKRDKMEMREVSKEESSRWEGGKVYNAKGKKMSTEKETDLILGRWIEDWVITRSSAKRSYHVAKRGSV